MTHDTILKHAALLLGSSGDAGMITDPNGTIQYVNPAFESITGYGQASALGRTPAILKSGQQSEAFYRNLWDTLRKGQEFRGILVNRRRDGSLYHEEKTIRPLFDADGSVRHFLSSGSDVSTRIEAMERLRFDATHDSLTGLPNRTLFMDRLEQALSRATRSGEVFAVALLDLNDFKSLNDALGHDAGDAALRASAQRLKRCLRQTDTAARLGGDEFALLLHDATDVARVMAALMEVCAEPWRFDGAQRPPLSLSVGVACFPDDGKSAFELMRRADEAMYRAKRSGGERSRWALSRTALQPEVASVPAPGHAQCGLALLEREVAVQRHLVKAGDTIYRVGERFRNVHVLQVGLCKLYGLSADGKEGLVTMLFKGDWLGLDGLADGRYRCSAIAADVCEVLTIRYDALLCAGARNPALLTQMLAAFARQDSRERDTVLNMHALPAEGRVAAFLCRWADELQQRGLRNDQIMLPTTRAEIGGHVGLRLESVSRAMTSLEREQLIRFNSRSRRDIEIPNLLALRDYVNRFSERN
ncbi:diguanylate cyclase [Mitsuaria sp. WAJ17]|uniref:diguanylate cyclase domain-containing protein n=1 Tax=Mitsuaria sp. WAJ17 TaxID=2761452 RepID=UPI001602EE97|nr:diguanylate cyclase [Mitsuaria sp. WAJ17]MBB2487476.1 diguanylate cyclase [Mitsuaria sp. WAJ17]